jgi:hypothetical protein
MMIKAPLPQSGRALCDLSLRELGLFLVQHGLATCQGEQFFLHEDGKGLSSLFLNRDYKI